MIRRIALIATLILAQSIPATALSREKDLDQWVDRELTPYVTQQLRTHPRFRDQTVMFVVLRDNAPAPTSNNLALSLRDRLLGAAVNTAGVSIGWRQGRSGQPVDARQDDCLRDRVHYYIGVEIEQTLDSKYTVSLRALDLNDRTWVTGFGKQWQGELSTVQRQAMRQQNIDMTFLGARDVPYTLTQTDMLAANLAHQLSCTLHQLMGEDYIASRNSTTQSHSALQGTVELISNNLAGRQALLLTDNESQANAVIDGKAHRIDGNLHQYWLTLTPDPEAGGLAALSASAYIVLPPESQPTKSAANPIARAEATPTPAIISIPNAGKDGLIGPLQISSPVSASRCRYPCSVLQTRANSDAVAFFLQHQANHGLVRLSDSDCRRRTTARLARTGEMLELPIAYTSTNKNDWNATLDWALQPASDTYYVVVVADDKAARTIADHIDQLPLRCSNALRPGLTDEQLRDWLAEFAVLTAGTSDAFDWRAISVQDLM